MYIGMWWVQRCWMCCSCGELTGALVITLSWGCWYVLFGLVLCRVVSSFFMCEYLSKFSSQLLPLKWGLEFSGEVCSLFRAVELTSLAAVVVFEIIIFKVTVSCQLTESACCRKTLLEDRQGTGSTIWFRIFYLVLGSYAILHLLIGMLSHIPWLRIRTAEWSKYRIIRFIKAVHQVKMSETVAMVFPYPLLLISLLERNNWLYSAMFLLNANIVCLKQGNGFCWVFVPMESSKGWFWGLLNPQWWVSQIPLCPQRIMPIKLSILILFFSPFFFLSSCE